MIELRKTEAVRPSSDFPAISAQDYAKMLRSLLVDGTAATKKSRLIAIPMVRLQVGTLNDSGGSETVKDFDFGHHVVFDPHVYGVDEARAVFRRIFAEYGGLVADAPEDLIALIARGEAGPAVSASAEGVWTMADGNLRADYRRVAEPFTYEVVPGTGRMCLDVASAFSMPTTWGGFNVRASGAIAVRFADVPPLAAALGEVEAGLDAKDRLLAEESGKRRARFDVYGMDPGFRLANYLTVAPPQAVADAIATLRR